MDLLAFSLLDSTIGQILSSIIYGGKGQYEMSKLTNEQNKLIADLQRLIANDSEILANQDAIASKIANFAATLTPSGKAYVTNKQAYEAAIRAVNKMRSNIASKEKRMAESSIEYSNKMKDLEERARDEQILSGSAVGGFIHQAKKLLSNIQSEKKFDQSNFSNKGKR